jgi:hypothetical protein
LYIGLAALIITVIGDTFYRDWIYSNNYFDFGLADCIPSITGTVSAIFLLCRYSKNFPKDIMMTSGSVIVGCAIYEILQPVFHTGIFDWLDLCMTIVTGSLVLLIFRILLKQQEDGAGK